MGAGERAGSRPTAEVLPLRSREGGRRKFYEIKGKTSRAASLSAYHGRSLSMIRLSFAFQRRVLQQSFRTHLFPFVPVGRRSNSVLHVVIPVSIAAAEHGPTWRASFRVNAQAASDLRRFIFMIVALPGSSSPEST